MNIEFKNKKEYEKDEFCLELGDILILGDESWMVILNDDIYVLLNLLNYTTGIYNQTLKDLTKGVYFDVLIRNGATLVIDFEKVVINAKLFIEDN